MTIKKIILIFILINFMPATQTNAAQLVDKIVAVVDSDIILLSEVRAREEMTKSRFRSAQKMTQREILEELIEEHLLTQEIDRLQIKVPQQEITQAINGILSQNRITLAQLKNELAAKGISWDTYQRQLEEHIKMMKFMGRKINNKVNITEDDYELYKKRYPQKAKHQSKEQMKEAIFEVKARDQLKSYLRDIRERTYVDIRDLN